MVATDRGAILPGATVGIFGDGQLGRMLAFEAARHGYQVHTFAPNPNGPAAQVAHRSTVAPYSDLAAVERFASEVDVVTLEFENVPPAALEAALRHAPVRPGPAALATTRHRIREKRFLVAHGHAVAPFEVPSDPDELPGALDRLGGRGVLKTATLGYDGKGQLLLGGGAGLDMEAAATLMAAGETVVEALVDIECELSVVAARGADGSIASYPPFENLHRHHILELTVAPARVAAGVALLARTVAEAILAQLDLVGVACVELFLTKSGELLVNEIAPRPHNSGHLTLGAAQVSQFAQQLRAVCGLPLGSVALSSPAAMVNLLGDLWERGEPDWRGLLGHDVALHLYGKAEARPGRKMGHLVAAAADSDAAERAVLGARDALLLADPPTVSGK
jgi:5-(carboxyamino)imidazole ribonucleotide synthase